LFPWSRTLPQISVLVGFIVPAMFFGSLGPMDIGFLYAFFIDSLSDKTSSFSQAPSFPSFSPVWSTLRALSVVFFIADLSSLLD